MKITNSSTPISIQIINYYKRYISLNILKPHEKLPSLRQLAISNGINIKTVEKAFNQLEKEGYIISVPNKGYFVKEIEEDNNLREILLDLKKSNYSYEEILEELAIIYGRKQ